MIRLRYTLRPIRSAKSLYRRLSAPIRQYFLERQFHNIRRGQCDQCWCGGDLIPFEWHASYGVCTECGCYVNQRPPLQEELKRLYSFDDYWHKRAQLKGHPTIEHRPMNDQNDGRLDYWLELIDRYSSPTETVIEVGCGSGVLLTQLKNRGYECIGVEPDNRTAEWVRSNMGLDVRAGLFPDVILPECDLFLAFDVIEHSINPEAFFKAIVKLLKPSGIAIIQTPIDRYNDQPPFKEMFAAVFDDLEHLYVFTPSSIHKLGTDENIEWIAQDERWRLAHEVVIFRTKA